MRQMIRSLLLVTGVLFLCAIGFAAWFVWQTNTPLAMKAQQIRVDISAGRSLRTVAEDIQRAGVDLSPWQFVLLGRLLDRQHQIKAGRYEIVAGATAVEVLNMLARGDSIPISVRLAEGNTFRQWRNQIDASPDFRHDSQNLTDAEIMAHIGRKGQLPEGLFFPDTYQLEVAASDLLLLKRAAHMMQTRLEEAWQTRAAGLPFHNVYEALILASIIEKETGQAADRAQVAAVFINRLHRDMRLQSDPTVIYGMGELFDGNLRKADLMRDTPYNTYTRKGLPPTPICMPSMASLTAALHPVASNALYFVGRGDGSSQFSDNLSDHNRAVNRYQRQIVN